MTDRYLDCPFQNNLCKLIRRCFLVEEDDVNNTCLCEIDEITWSCREFPHIKAFYIIQVIVILEIFTCFTEVQHVFKGKKCCKFGANREFLYAYVE